MKYKSYNDNELIYLIRENDDDSLDILFKKYRPIIISLCNYYYSRIKDRGADYNDLVQEANISLYQAYLKYDDKLGVIFYTFACSCIRNRLSSYTRTFFNQKNNIINTSISYDDSLFGTYSNYYDMEYDFVTNKNKLSFDQSIVYELNINGFSYKEISILLDIPISTVSGRLCKIRMILRS